eukprot:XP_001701475.1 voltage-gated Ca2+ channel, alpha subunit [Chlamydomonas reinhardtii]
MTYPEYSLLFLRKSNFVRKWCVYTTHTRVFEWTILAAIIANCVTLAVSSNRQDFDETPLGRTLVNLEYLWVAIFTTEALLKIVAMGFVLAPGTYLRDGWNIVDFTVVALGFVDIFSSGNLTALRTVRVLRPLRAITRIRGMRILVTTMIAALPMLIDVFALCAFTFFIFGLVAVQLFSGRMTHRCAVPVFDGSYTEVVGGSTFYRNVTYVVQDEESGDGCSGPMSEGLEWVDVNGTAVALAGGDGLGRACPDGLYCTNYGNPNYGITSFDHILWAWLTIFQMITQEGWTDIMYFTSDTITWWVWPFFVALVAFGSFYIINLALAVLFMQFSNDNHADDPSKKKSGRQGSGDGQRQGDKAGAGGGGAANSGGEHKDSDSESSMSDVGSEEDERLRPTMAEVTGLRTVGQHSTKLKSATSSPLTMDEVERLSPFRRRLYRVAASRWLELFTMSLIILNTVLMCINWFEMPESVERATNYINYVFTVYFLVEMILKMTAFGLVRYFRDGMNIFDCLVVVISVTEMVLDIIPSVSGLGPLSVLRAFRLLRIFRLARSWKELNLIIRAIFKSITSTTYLLLLMLLFMFIASLMGMQLFGYKFMFCDYVEGAAPTCPLGWNVWGQCPDHFHCYLPCMSADYGSWVNATGSFYNDLAYCERFCANDQAAAAADANATSPDVAAAGGCEYLAMVGKSEVPRANFDNIFWSMYTVFQILTMENWNNIMYDGMRSTTPWCAAYFVAVVLIGTYLVFNLFVAILLDNFSSVFGESDDSDGSGSGSLKADGQAAGSGKHKSRRSSSSSSDTDSLHDSDLDAGEAGDAFGSMRSHCEYAGNEFADSPHADDASRPSSPGGTYYSTEGYHTRFSREYERAHGAGTGRGSGEGGGAGYTTHEAHAQRATGGPGGGHAPTGASPAPQQGEGEDVAAAGGADGPGAGAGPGIGIGIGGSRRAPPTLHLPDSPSAVGALPPIGPAHQPVPSPKTPFSAGIGYAHPSPGAKGGHPVTQSPSDLSRGLRGVLRKVVPVDDEGRPGSSHSGSQPPRPSLRPVSAAPRPLSSVRGGGGNRVRPVSGRPPVKFDGVDSGREGGGGGGVTFANDAVSRRASFIAAHQTAAAGSQGAGEANGGSTSQGGLAASISRSIGRSIGRSVSRTLQRAMSSIRSIREVRHNEHLAKQIKGRSLLLLDPEHWVRWRAARMVHHTHFETVILGLIVLSSITLALDSPGLDPDSQLAQALRYLDYIFLGAFTLEAALKIITFGFAFTGKHAYIRNGWNVLDFIIVLAGYALLAVELSGANGEDLKMLRILRTLRALRPLRAASRYEGLKLVVNTLFAVLPAMADVALVCALFYIIFSILAVNLFKGQLYNCIDADSGERLDPYYLLPPGQTLERGMCEAGSITVNSSVYTAARNISLMPYNITTSWVNPVANFDNVAISMLTLFQIATLELWVDIMFTAVDVAGVGKQPLWNNHPVVILFFILVVIVCCFFVLNLFIGVTLDKFTELQQAQTASSVFVTPQQQNWVDVQKLLLRTGMTSRPARFEEPAWRAGLYDFVMGSVFEEFILITIVVNVLFMAMVHADMSPQWQACMTYTNLIFTCVFVIEAALKIMAFGAFAYFRDRWNAFDFFVVVISVASVVLDFSGTQNLSFMPVLRVLRVVRVVRLIRRAVGMRRLLLTLVQSLPALGNVGGVMVLFFFVYAVIGMNLFGGIKFGDYISRHANFNNFGKAMLLLFRQASMARYYEARFLAVSPGRMITGESWSGVMQDCMITHNCVLITANVTAPATNATLVEGTYLSPNDPSMSGLPPDVHQNQCSLSPWAAVVYFPTFIVLCGFILLNLVIAIILENMITSENDEGLTVSKSLVGQFVDAWSQVDNCATGYVHASKLPLIISHIEPPLGTRGQGNARAVTQAVIMSVDVPIHENNTVTFVETLHALAGRVAGTELPEIEEEWLVEKYSKRLPDGGAAFPKLTAAHFHAALYVQAAIRGFMARHKMRGMMQTLAGGPGGAGGGTGSGSGADADGLHNGGKAFEKGGKVA